MEMGCLKYLRAWRLKKSPWDFFPMGTMSLGPGQPGARTPLGQGQGASSLPGLAWWSWGPGQGHIGPWGGGLPAATETSGRGGGLFNLSHSWESGRGLPVQAGAGGGHGGGRRGGGWCPGSLADAAPPLTNPGPQIS